MMSIGSSTYISFFVTTATVQLAIIIIRILFQQVMTLNYFHQKKY